MDWTPDQQKVIDLRNRNILVSAAAGSGKTAVLVARIISMISEGEHPIDIDRLLIVTFTNAAAAEMRERIGVAIEKKITEMPDNLNLQKQMTLIHSAQITTIHSFCLNVIRNHFNMIDLDPSFRIADEAELTLLKSDVIGDLLEDYYEEGKEEFLDFIESFSSGKSDIAIEELILKLHNFSMSYPWPEDWLEEKKNTFSITNMEDMKESDWMKVLIANIQAVVGDMVQKCEEAIRVCEEVDGPTAYLSALRSDESQLDELVNLHDYEKYMEALSDFTFARLSGKKEEGVSDDKKNQVKTIREEFKKAITDLKKNYFFQAEEEMLEDIKAMKPAMEVLIELTKDFAVAFANKKSDKNLIDFNDLEHFALNILVQRVEGNIVPTSAANELSEHYEEILIDEYQDSNLVQETILNSISGERFGRPNLFMVGDVKQSIYKFRLARPEIFMEKYESYDTEDSQRQRVDLHKNFRSREVVLDSINFIFEQIMTKKLGNILYNEQVALYPGADFGTHQEGVSMDTEIILVSVEPTESEGEDFYQKSTDIESDENTQEEEEYTSKELEAKAIAKRIRELTNQENGLLVYDKKKDQHHIAQYGDIVILLRTMSNWAEIFADTLAAEGIAAHTETQSGYFSTLEIRTILNLLRIIDNPRQDIPFTSILRSPIVDLSSNELAAIRIPNRHITMYEAALEYVNEHTVNDASVNDTSANDTSVNDTNVNDTSANDTSANDTRTNDTSANDTSTNDIRENDTCTKDGSDSEETGEQVDKLKKFLDKLEQYRSMVYYLPIHELILRVLDDTGYYDFVSAMPAGNKRRANIDMLVQRAIRFETTSYSGLFHFVRYIEKLHKYDVDFGEAKIVGENDNTIKIMSIHKSKGLEFPIVFVAGMGKNFNNQDSRSKLLIHPDLGLGPDYMNHQLRVKAPTLVKKVIQKELVLENLGEELRVLYVAMTRAKEKLILTGGVKKLDNKLTKWGIICRQEEKQLLFYQLSNATTYLDWIIPATMRYRGFEDLLQNCGIMPNKNNPLYQANTEIVLKKNSYEELAQAEIVEQIYKNKNQDELIHWNNQAVYDKEIRDEIQSRMEYQYPYQAESKIHTKLTVSELKKLGQMEVEDLGVHIKGVEKKEKNIPIPDFIRSTDTVGGADLGTLYHCVLEYINLSEIESREDLDVALLKLLTTGKISQAELEILDIEKLHTFTTSSVADRMRRAREQRRLYVERRFVMGMKANEINSSMRSEELVLIQGVIDVYFEEDNQWILLDYKTDVVNELDGEKILIKRYIVQLDYYQKALEQLTGKSVRERFIYSFALGKAIMVPRT